MYCSAQLAPVEGSLYWWDRRLLPLTIKGPMRKEKCFDSSDTGELAHIERRDVVQSTP